MEMEDFATWRHTKRSRFGAGVVVVRLLCRILLHVREGWEWGELLGASFFGPETSWILMLME